MKNCCRGVTGHLPHYGCIISSIGISGRQAFVYSVVREMVDRVIPITMQHEFPCRCRGDNFLLVTAQYHSVCNIVRVEYEILFRDRIADGVVAHGNWDGIMIYDLAGAICIRGCRSVNRAGEEGKEQQQRWEPKY